MVSFKVHHGDGCLVSLLVTLEKKKIHTHLYVYFIHQKLSCRLI